MRVILKTGGFVAGIRFLNATDREAAIAEAFALSDGHNEFDIWDEGKRFYCHPLGFCA